jgi:hypothetical protein
MRTYTPRELRHAILLTVALTVTATFALFDPSCRPVDHRAEPGSRSLAPH